MEQKVEEKVEEELDVEVRSLEEVEEGVNTLYVVETDEEKYVYKIGTFDPESVEIEPHLLKILNDNGVPTPEIHWIGETMHYPSFIGEYLEGNHLGYANELSRQKVLRVADTVGEILGKIQKIEMKPGRLEVKNGKLKVREQNWEELFYDALRTFSEQAKSNYPEIGSNANRIAHRIGPSELDEKPKLCPLDMHTANVFMKDRKVEGIIDMERVYIGDPRWAYEVTVHTLYAGKENIENEIRDKFSKGYSRQRPIPKKSKSMEILAILREMRAAHIWWEDKNTREKALKNKLQEIESNL